MEAEAAVVALLDRDAIERAHHKYYASRRGQECGEPDEYDREYVDILLEILALMVQDGRQADRHHSST
ncbi:hypothetical protein GCM10009745_32930 [Kribbella yunnanensis]|uniref:Tetracycline repressor TetR C-terminal domain-containing protein n=1 Tax=Kribbella yunnanensis TaxID=190194 RepID=A0ABN2HCY0_9ACTN